VFTRKTGQNIYVLTVMSNCTYQDTTVLSLVNAEIQRVTEKNNVTLFSYAPALTGCKITLRRVLAKIVTIFMMYQELCLIVHTTTALIRVSFLEPKNML